MKVLACAAAIALSLLSSGAAPSGFQTQPGTNIAIGMEYLADLNDQFDGLYESIAASYNGGEDNAARWLNRSQPKEPGIFASEVGFAETKNYVFKVMTNYRIYRDLYDENLNRR